VCGAIQRRFDEDITPRIRRAVLDALLAPSALFRRRVRRGRIGAEATPVCLIVPLAAPLVRKGNGISGAAAMADGIAAGARGTGSGRGRRRRQGYLVGEGVRHRGHHGCRGTGHRGAPG
jgi:hypothetical protein